MMKSLLVITLLCAFRVSVHAQIKNDDYKKMIDTAILLQTMDIKVPYHTGIYILDEYHRDYFLASDSINKKFVHMNIYDKKNIKLLKKGINAWKIIPRLNGITLVINIVNFNIKFLNQRYDFANGGGAKVIFKYKWESNKWELVDSKWIGI